LTRPRWTEGIDLLFTMLRAGASSSVAAKAVRPLLLEVLLLAQQQAPVELTLLVRRLLAHVLSETSPTRAAPTAVGGGAAALGLPCTTADVIEVRRDRWFPSHLGEAGS
jgi:hypothetical protein